MKRNLLIGISLIIYAAAIDCKTPATYNDWRQYNGSDENIHYSSLTQVDTGNVQKLQITWQYHTGDIDAANHSQMQCNPIIVDGIKYGTPPMMKLFTIDVASGREKWKFNPFDSLAGNKIMFFILNNRRGVTYWTDGAGDRRIFYTAGSDVYAINVTDGKPVRSFGVDDKIDLHEGLDRNVKGIFVTTTSPGMLQKLL
jgi:quinoprotein glucose dehydrogenase